LIFISGVLQVLIGVLQFIKQKSIGLKILGESFISPDVPGVAKIEIAGEKIIRAYGTFPHPNLFAAFLFSSLICGLSFLFFHQKEIPLKIRLKIPSLKINKNKLLNIHYLSGLLLIFLGILISYSRSVWLISLIAISIIIWKYLPRSKISYLKEYLQISLYKKALAILFSLGLLLAISWLAIPRLCLKDCPQDSSFSLRQKYNTIAIDQIKNNPFFGIGIGNFVFKMQEENFAQLQKWELQPVHNFYLIIITEIGLVGFAILITLIFYRLKTLKPPKTKWNKTAIYTVSGFLLLGLFDHYFWTIPQGILLFWLTLAFLAVYSYNEKKL
jgi:O-antigen ligase